MEDKDSAFTAEGVQFSCRTVNFQLLIISPFNGISLQMERQMYITGKIIPKHHKGKAETRQLHTAVAVYAINTFASPASIGFSPFDLVFMCKPQDLLNEELPLLEQFTRSHKDYP